MLAYAFLMTFLVGLFLGGIGITTLALRMEVAEVNRLRVKIHPSGRETFNSDILTYTEN